MPALLVCSKALTSREKLGEGHAKDRAKGLTPDQLQQLYVYFIDCECPALCWECQPLCICDALFGPTGLTGPRG